MEEPNNYSSFDEKYRESIKFSLNDGSYFKDAFSWYSSAFLNNISDRTFYVFLSIMGILIIFYVMRIFLLILPLKEDIFISIKEKDLTQYQTSIIDLTLNSDLESTDEEILKYLLTNYVKERETHNYKTANINDMNLKLTRIKNTSSGDVFSAFRNFMGSGNRNGPYYFFGKNIETYVDITGFKFIRIVRTKLKDKIIDFFNIKLLPIKAEVYYTLTTDIAGNIKSQKRKAVMTFKYGGVEFDKKTNKYTPAKVIVTSYQNYMVGK